MRQETVYKGYRVVSRSVGRWFAQIFPPNGGRPLSETPIASREEGYERLLARAFEIIDRKLDTKFR